MENSSPRPLLFHLRHPNSKTNQSKFCKILSPKNSFCKTSSTLFRHLPETLRAEHQRKMYFPFSRKISPPPRERSKGHFSLVLPSEARRWRGFRRAYDLVSSHHALRAWHIVSDFGNRCELGTIETPINKPSF